MDNQNTEKIEQQSLPGLYQLDETGITPTKDGRRRFQFKFWLDVAKDELYTLALELEELKQKRQFAPTIRNALTLFFSLRRGEIDLLETLFPDVVERIRSDESEEVKQFKAIVREQRRQGQLLEQLTNGTADSGSASSGPQKLNIPTFQTPAFDDDLPDIELKKDTSTASGQNFLNSMLALQGGKNG